MINRSSIQGFLGRITGSEYIRNIATLASGHIIAQLLSFITAPISSRIFTPFYYGQMGVYMSITGILGTLMYSHYPQAIFQAKETEEAKNIVWFCLALAALLSGISLVGIYCIFFWTHWLDSVGLWAYTLPFSLFFTASITIITIWANRSKKYAIISSNRIAQSVLTVAVQLSFGIWVGQAYGLMAGLLTGQTVGLILIVRSFMFGKEANLGRPDASKFLSYLKKYKDYVFYTTPSDFINNLVNQLPIYFLNAYAGLTMVGSFSFAQRVLGLPITMFSSSIADVFRQRATEQYLAEGQCIKLFDKTFKTLFVVGFIPCFTLGLFGPELFAWVFGENWRTAGIMTQFLSISFLFRIAASPLSYMFIIAGRMREDLIVHFIIVFLMCIAFIVPNMLLENKLYLVLSYSIMYACIYVYYIIRGRQFATGWPKQI